MIFKAEIENEKEYFLKNQFWALTIAASFARAKVYIKKVDWKQANDESFESKKNLFKKELFNKVEDLVNRYYILGEVSTDKHTQLILEIKNWSIEHKKILKAGEIKFGIAQKLLNLYLKYLWCANIIKYTPPHFPLDRMIQRNKQLINWTELNDSVLYNFKINQIHAGSDKAVWELIKYNNLLRK